MRYILILFQIVFAITVSGQILDLEMECPIVMPHDSVAAQGLHSISFGQSGDVTYTYSKRKIIKKSANLVTTYYFDTSGVPVMKTLNDGGSYADTFLMNKMRCRAKENPESEYYEENLFCNDRGMVLAYQTEKSNFYYRYDTTYRLTDWIEIDHNEEDMSNVLLTQYRYDSIGRLDSLIEKEGALLYNLGVKEMDTIYKSTVARSVHYSDDKMSAVVTYTKNNREKLIAASTYKYRYKGDKLDRIELYIGEEKTPIYTLKVLKREIIEREDREDSKDEENKQKDINKEEKKEDNNQDNGGNQR